MTDEIELTTEQKIEFEKLSLPLVAFAKANLPDSAMIMVSVDSAGILCSPHHIYVPED